MKIIKNISIGYLLPLLSISYINAAKILAVFPLPNLSHQTVFRHYTNALIQRGHEVTVITTDPEYAKGQAPTNLEEIDLHNISYTIWTKVIQTSVKGSNDIVKQLEEFLIGLLEVYEEQFKSKEIQELLKETKQFDLIVVEACVKIPLIYSHIYKAPVIAISSFGGTYYNYDMMGAPYHPFLYPTMIMQRFDNLTLFEKIKEAYNFFRYKMSVDGFCLENENQLLRRLFGPDVPSVIDLGNNIDLMFFNADPLWMANVPLPPNVINIWGIHKRVEKELPKDLKSFLDSSKHGVIYMSFGTNAFPSSLAKEKIQAFLDVFSQLPYDVIWKWDKDELPGRPHNVRIGKWFPQSDLLRHPKLKLFLTQGGLQSTEEAILAGVPLVGVPLLGDQWFNVEMYQRHGIGLQLDIETLNEDAVRETVERVIQEKSFRENIVRLRSWMQDKPDDALDRAMWWTDYVIRHGGAKHLRSPAANLTWAQYYDIELVATVIFVVIFIITAFLCLISYLIRLWRKQFELIQLERKFKTS